MKTKVGDFVCPSRLFGKVVKVSNREVVIEINDSKGRRLFKLTEEMANLRKIPFDKFIDSEIKIVNEV